jgi:hypothetical protein
VLLRHTGTYTFDGNTQEQTYRDLKAVFEPSTVVPPSATADLPEAAPEATVIASSKKPKKAANSK